MYWEGSCHYQQSGSPEESLNHCTHHYANVCVFTYVGIPAASFLVVGDCVLIVSCTCFTQAMWNEYTTTLSCLWLGALTINTSGHIKPLCPKPFCLHQIPIFSFNTLIYQKKTCLHTTYLLQKRHHTRDIPVELWTVVYLSFIVVFFAFLAYLNTKDAGIYFRP